MITDYVSYVTI